MTKHVIAALLAASFALPAAPGFAQTAAETATDVAPVTVRAPRQPPAEIMPEYAACISAAVDPYVAAMLSIEDIDAAPRIFVPTRPPRNPDYDAPPKSRPGSPMPPVMSLKDYQRYAARMWRLRDAAAQPQLTAEAAADADADGAATPALASGEATYMRAVARCLEQGRRGPGGGSGGGGGRVFMSGPGVEPGPSGPVAPGGGRVEIRFRDKSLPLGFALFDDGRYEEALEQFKTADRKFYNDEAGLMIGKIYLFGLKEKSDPIEGVRWLKEITDRPFRAWTSTPVFDPREPERNTATGEAAMILADLYRDGRGPIARDPAMSRAYLEKAYAFGHIPAAKLLGDIYYEGRDTPRDLALAFKHYKDAAKFAYIPAMLAVADMYAAGEVEGGPNPGMALAWRNEAAKLDDASSLYALAVAYDRGEGVAADPDRALALYKLAAMNGQPAAMSALGTYFYEGEGGLPRDPAVARQWFEQAALGADADGMFNLAAMMAKGEGGAVDRVRAWGWLKIAQRQGHPNAAAALAALEAQFVETDRAGVLSLTKAARDGNAASHAALGEDPERTIDAAFVGTAPGGPPWWKVSKDGATVWIMGLPAGRTLSSQKWDATALRRVLRDSRLVLATYSPWDMVSGAYGARYGLPVALGADLRAAAQKARMPLRDVAPTLNDALVTHATFYARGSLTERAPDNFSRIVVRDERASMAYPTSRRPPSPSTLHPEAAAACVRAIIADLGEPQAASLAAGKAWAAGDVKGALAAPPGAEWGCQALWPGHWERSVGFLTEAVAMALDMPGKVVAAIDIGQLVAEDGVLPRLRDMGLEVSGPLQPTEP